MNYICMICIHNLVKDCRMKVTYEEAKENGFKKGLAPLGEEYQGILTEGLLTTDGLMWFENKGKRKWCIFIRSNGTNP